MVCRVLFIIYYTSYSYRRKDRLLGKAGKGLTCFRVSVALVLLGIVSVFALLQWYEWWPDPERFHSAGTNIMNISKEHGDHHHHTTLDEDDEHEDGEDGHHHEHTALYHHAVVLTASGLDFLFSSLPQCFCAI